MSKRKRQEALIEIISSQNIETQEELLDILTSRGFSCTQATISRDIKELNITKISYSTSSGVDNRVEQKHKYTIAGEQRPKHHESYKQVLGNCIVSMDYAENIIVIKTVAGMAMAVGAAIDQLDIVGIMGCIAGDDTLFLAIKNPENAMEIIGSIKNVVKFAY